MASSSKKKTTFAKMNRETKVREKRMLKAIRKDERKQAAAAALDAPPEPLEGEDELAEGETEGETAEAEADSEPVSRGA